MLNDLERKAYELQIEGLKEIIKDLKEDNDKHEKAGFYKCPECKMEFYRQGENNCISCGGEI